jgi:hypothetical protein
LDALRRTGVEWVVAVAVDVMAMGTSACVWSEKEEWGPQLQNPIAKGPVAPSGDGSVAAFDEACAGDGGGGEGEGEVGGFWFGEA